MTNREIEFLLTLKDQLTAKWNSTMAQMKNSVKDLATTFQANWASITAGWFAVRQAVMDLAEWAQQWIKTETLAASFRAMVTQMGGDADKEFAKIKEAAAGMLEDAPIYQQANKLMSLGYSYKSIADLMVLSRVKAREYSITEQEAWERLSDAVARGSARKLKSIGISVDAKFAAAEYANQIGEEAKNLSTAEQKQALMNEVLRVGSDALARQNLDVKTLSEELQTVKAQYDQITTAIGGFAMRALIVLAGVVEATAAFGGQMALVLISPLARAQEAMIKMGISTSTGLIDLEKKIASEREGNLQSMANHFKRAFEEGEKAAGATKQTALNTDEAGHAALKFADNLQIAKMKALEMLYISDAQEKRYKSQLEVTQRMAWFAKLDADMRRELLEENNKAWLETQKHQKGVEQPEFSRGLPEAMQTQFSELVEKIRYLSSPLTDSLTEGFRRGLENGQLLLSDFIDAALSSTASMFAQQAGILGAAGILSLFGVGEFGALATALGSIFKFASGGMIAEPVLGFGMNSGHAYAFGESGPEYIMPAIRGDNGVSGLRSDIQTLTRTVKNSRPMVHVGGVVTPKDMMAGSIVDVNRRVGRCKL